MSNVLVVGAGAAGMMAAIAAAEMGHQVTILERNEKTGKKIFITGKGRCNVTNASDMEQIFANVMTNSKFLYSALYSFDNQAVMELLENHGCKLKIERGNRVFPESDHSSDVIRTLERILKDYYVDIHLNTRVKNLIISEDNKVLGVVDYNNKKYMADAVILATGGVSYETTGSTGDGIHFAKKTGHQITELYPALVPLKCEESFCRDLMGLSLKNVQVTIKDGKKVLYDDFGEMLFTHYGVSGPLILSASSKVTTILKDHSLPFTIDLKPALTVEQLDKRLIRDFDENKQKQFKNALNGLFPSRLIPIMIKLSGIDPEKKVCEISKIERLAFANLIKAFPLTAVGTADFKEAIITKGGVSVKDINPSTMESKIVKGLYFVGEMIDVDALTGGYNLQIAWSTGHLAGSSIEY